MLDELTTKVLEAFTAWKSSHMPAVLRTSKTMSDYLSGPRHLSAVDIEDTCLAALHNDNSSPVAACLVDLGLCHDT